jgi:hypothetical protein
MSRGSSRCSSWTTPPRVGSSSTTSPQPHVRVPRHVTRLVAQARRRLLRGAQARRRLLRIAQARRRQLRLVQAHRLLLRLRRVSGCLGTSRGSSCGSSRCSSSTTLLRAGSSLTTAPPPRVRVPWHVARLVTRLVAPHVVDYSASRRLIVDYFASRRLVVEYFAYTARPGASARRAARRAARRRLLCIAQAHRRLLGLRRVSGCLGTSCGSSRGSSRRSLSTTLRRAGSSSTTSPPPCVLVPRHVARLVTRLVAPLVVDYFASAARPGPSARRAARHAARLAACCRQLRLRRASGFLSTSCGSSRVLVVDYFDYAARPGASARRAARHAARCRLL